MRKRCWLATSPVLSRRYGSRPPRTTSTRASPRVSTSPANVPQAAAISARYARLRGRQTRRTPPFCSRSEVKRMRPMGLPCCCMTSAQASTHCAVPMHSGCRPRRMSDARRTGADALAARDAVAGEHADDAVLQSHLGVAALLVVRHQDRVLVGHHVLEPAVGARDRAHLVAEPAEVEEDQRAEQRNREERARPGERGRGEPAREGHPADEVGTKFEDISSATTAQMRPLRRLDRELAPAPRHRRSTASD